MRTYEIGDWYWTVGGDEARAYSSAVRDYVPADDAAFVAFVADGNAPIAVDTEFNLGLALGTLPLNQAPLPAGIYEGYRSANANNIVYDATFPVLLDHENRIRGLAGQETLTPEQFAALIAKLGI